jgi:hypothetical protein
MAVKDTGPLDWSVPIVDSNGRPSPEFQRRWQTQRANNSQIGAVSLGSGAPPASPAPADGAEYVDISTTPFTVYIGQGGTWHKAGVTAFVELSDVPNAYTGQGGKVVQVNTGATGLQFIGLSALLDLLGNTRGAILERGAAGWTLLAPGTSGFFLKSGGAGADPSYVSVLVVGFIMSSGATGTNVGPELIAPRAGAFTKCKVVTKASDATTDLTFKIKQNGVDVFATDPTVAHGTAGGTLSTFTTLTSSPLAVAADDIFTIDVTSGTATWQFTVQLE